MYISKLEAQLGDETTDDSVNRRLPFVKESSGNRPMVQWWGTETKRQGRRANDHWSSPCVFMVNCF